MPGSALRGSLFISGLSASPRPFWVSALAQVCAPSFLPEVHQREESTTAVVAANPGLDVSLAQSAAAVTAEPEEALQSFIKETAVPATKPILQTPAKNTTAAKGADE
jgi:hypothetical protein